MARKTIASELGLSLEQVQAGLALLEKPRKVTRRRTSCVLDPAIVREGTRISSTDLYTAERAIARHIYRLQSAVLPSLELPADAFGGLAPDESQRAAVEMACTSGVVVMTGGPGVGKTTVARAIIAAYRAAGLQVTCCAPTGKAAIRMREQTGEPAATVHNTIGLIPGGRPRHNSSAPIYSPSGAWVRNGPIATGAVVLDETSMVDVRLLADLLDAVPDGARLLIVGDVDQLPSIGPGRVLFDLITSQALPVVRLTKIHRQAEVSRIPYVARDLNQGRLPTELTKVGSDFTHWETVGAENAADRIIRAVTDPAESITARKGIPVTEVQVVAAQYKGPCGVVALNTALQERLNPTPNNDHNSDIFIGRSYSTRTGDRVIQTRNNYDLGPVMNGEMGYVVAADPSGLSPTDFDLDTLIWSGKNTDDGPAVADPWADRDTDADADADDADKAASASAYGGLMTIYGKEATTIGWEVPRVLVVRFADKLIAYSKTEARELDLGYAITVHRSQGSQFSAVIMALYAENTFMLTRALLYTAVTRAEKFCLTVGTADLMGRAARNTRGTERRTALQARLATTDTKAAASSLTHLTLL